MKSITKHIKYICITIIALGLFFANMLSSQNTIAIKMPGQASLSGNQLELFSNNQITIYNPNECVKETGNSTLCGEDAREKYWTALRQHFSVEATAGIFGNIDSEGGFSPIGVESCTWLWPFNFATSSWGNGWPSWEYYYDNNLSQSGQPTGTGAFGITAGRSEYLHYINDEAPDLIQYFQYPDKYAPILDNCQRRDPSAKTPGDDVLNQIGDEDFDRLVELEVAWMYKTVDEARDFDVEYFNKLEPGPAAAYFLTHYERPAYPNPGARAALAQKDYEELKDFECESTSAGGTLSGTGDFAAISKAKNAEKSYFNHAGDVPSAHWSDTDPESMKVLLETYGDLAYQLGRAIGAPWIAILVQMRYEDAYSECGSNNFWGNGCNKEHSCIGCSSIQGKDLAEGFKQYGETLTTYRKGGSLWYTPVLGESSPKKYLEKIGPRWVQGEVDGAGYGDIEAMKDSVNALTKYVNTPEGQEIVESFYNYNGINYNGKESKADTSDSSSSSSSSSSHSSSSGSSSPSTSTNSAHGGSVIDELDLNDLDPSGEVDGSQVTFLGDSIIALGTERLFKEYFNDTDYGTVWNQPGFDSYIRSGRFAIDNPASSDGPGGIVLLRKLAEENKIRDTLVFELGGNGAQLDTIMDEILEIAGPNRHVIFVTTYWPECYYSLPHIIDPNKTRQAYIDQNEFLRELAEKHDNVTIADWASVVPTDDWYGSDCMHPKSDKLINGQWNGYNAIYKIIEQAILDKGSGCTTYEGEYPQYPQQTDHTCGQASIAMLATVATGSDVTENDIVQLVGDQSYPSSRGSTMAVLDKKVGDEFGFVVEQVNVNEGDKSDIINKMRQYLQDGYMLHFSGAGGCPYPSDSGHYVGLYDIDEDDNVTVANSGFAQCSNKMKLSDVVNNGYHGDAFTAIKGAGFVNGACDRGSTCRDDGGGSGIVDGGFDSAEEADEIIMSPYRELYSQSSTVWNQYHLAGGPDNCVSFTKYFITKYLDIDFKGEAMGDGGAVADNFYDIFKDRYPELEKSDKPSAYSVASCGEKSYHGNYSHTFIVLGVDEASDKMIIGEAGFGCGIGFTTAKEYSLTDPGSGSHNGAGGIPCTFVNVNAYVKGLK